MITKHTLLRRFIQEHRQSIALTLGVGLANSVVTLLLPLSLGRFYEQLFGASNRGKLLDSLGLELVGHDLTSFFVFFSALITSKGLLEYAENRRTGRLSETFAKSLREQLFTHQLLVPLATHRQKPVGKYLLRYGSDLKSIRNYLTKGLVLFTRDILFLMLAIGVLAYLNTPLTLLIGISTIPFLFVFRWVNGKMRDWSQKRRDQRAAYLAFVSRRLEGLITVKIFNRESVEIDRFTRRSEKLTATGNQNVAWRSVRDALLPVATFVLVAVLLAAIAFSNSGGMSRINGGVLIAFLLLVLNLRPVLRRLLRVGAVWQSGNLSFASLTTLLNQPVEPQPPRNTKRIKLRADSVTFEHVSFGYDADKPVLNALSFVAKKGGITHITGKPGAGKSTLFALLLKLYVPGQGRILIGKRDTAPLPVKAVRRAVTLVSDAVPLLGQTVFEAISYSRSTAKRSRADEVLNQLQTVIGPEAPLNLDDPIGESGRNLSAGQRRVLMLARALLTDKPVLLLDEPFAGMSALAGQRLSVVLNELAETKVVLLITHRDVPGLAISQTVRLSADEWSDATDAKPAVTFHLN